MLSSLLRALRGYIAVLNADPSVPVVPPKETEIPRVRKDTPRWVHLALFLATFITTTLAGAGDRSGIIAMLVSGLPFSLTLMAILLTHEMGHYLAARRFGLRATLPYFIPLPHWISPIGTLGAVIRIKSPLRERRALLYVGAAGPLAGFIVSLAAVVAGISFSEILPLPVGPPGSYTFIFGDSLLFRFITLLTHGPVPPGHDIFLSPCAWAGWIGFLVTSLNLMPLGQLDGGHILHALIGRKQVCFGWAAFITLLILSVSWPGWGVWILMVLLFLRVGHPVLGDMTPLGIKERVIGWSCMMILLLTFVPAPVDILENDTIFPLDCQKCAAPLEPSGLALMDGRLLMVSDSEGGVFELEKGERGYRALPWMRPGLTGRAVHGCDFEGLALHENLFFIADERNRRVLVSDATGRTELLAHDIADYNRRHGIAFSRESNAGFEGIAVDPARGTVFLLNEREPAVIYRLEKNEGALRTSSHLDLGSIKELNISDASDLFFDRGYLYMVARRANRIIKLDPGNWKVAGQLDYAGTAVRLYLSEKGFGFAEGLCMDGGRIYLVFDSNGQALRGSREGKNGTLVILPRPAGF
jgi:Zn-dependent protease